MKLISLLLATVATYAWAADSTNTYTCKFATRTYYVELTASGSDPKIGSQMKISLEDGGTRSLIMAGSPVTTVSSDHGDKIYDYSLTTLLEASRGFSLHVTPDSSGFNSNIWGTKITDNCE